MLNRPAFTAMLMISLVFFAGCSRSPSEAIQIKYQRLSPFTDGPVQVLIGQLDALQKTAVAFPIAGTVTTVTVELGDTVLEDQILATLDLDPLEAAKTLAVANLDKAKEDLKTSIDKLKTAEQMKNAGVGSPRDYAKAVDAWDLAKKVVAQEEQHLEEADKALNLATLRAPQSGLIAKRDVIVGDFVAKDQRIFEIHPVGSLHVFLNVPEEQLQMIQKDPKQAVAVLIEERKGAQYHGLVETVGLIPPDSNAAPVMVSVSPQDSLRAGMKANVLFSTQDPEHPVWHLEKSIFKSIKGKQGVVYLYDAQAGVVHEQEVTLGQELAGDSVEVIEGLLVGNSVVTYAAKPLEDGFPVTSLSSGDLKKEALPEFKLDE